jgi:hypothetical protein
MIPVRHLTSGYLHHVTHQSAKQAGSCALAHRRSPKHSTSQGVNSTYDDNKTSLSIDYKTVTIINHVPALQGSVNAVQSLRYNFSSVARHTGHEC